jgi:hypothetical protein
VSPGGITENKEEQNVQLGNDHINSKTEFLVQEGPASENAKIQLSWLPEI